MLALNGSAFTRAVRTLEMLRVGLSMHARINNDPLECMSEVHIPDALKHCQELKEALAILGSRLTTIANDRLIEKLRKPNVLLDQFCKSVADIGGRLEDELSSTKLLVLESGYAAYFASDGNLFGCEVIAKFPKLTEDISESGNCLALSRPTAAVFHLMRIMEVGVQQLGTISGVSLVSEKNWQNILDKVNKAIKFRDQKDTLTRQYAEVSAHLYNVKLCWRNEVMHPKQTYTEEEAMNVFSACRTFTQDLSSTQNVTEPLVFLCA